MRILYSHVHNIELDFICILCLALRKIIDLFPSEMSTAIFFFIFFSDLMGHVEYCFCVNGHIDVLSIKESKTFSLLLVALMRYKFRFGHSHLIVTSI